MITLIILFFNWSKLFILSVESENLPLAKSISLINSSYTPNPNINNSYKATNIYLETNKKPSIDEITNLILSSYKNFLVNLDTFNYESFKKKAEKLSIK